MKNKTLLIWLFFVCLALSAKAQDTITVMQYNLLQYGNYNAGYSGCNESCNNTQNKDECIRTILDYVKPDIFTVCEFGATQTLHENFIRHNLNINGANYWQSDNIINQAHSNIVNHIFYDSRKMGLKRHIAIGTSPRDSDVYELYMKTPSLAAGDTLRLVCIVTHPKAGQNEESARRACMQLIMDYINLHYPTDNVLIMGDFNMYGANESGYRLLTQTYSNANIRFVDPLSSVGGVGAWNNNIQFAAFHTQSTRSNSDNCFSSGGLDDRFDFILMADEIMFSYNHLRYVQNSYHAVGNDGRHYNQSVNQNGNSSVPPLVAEALYDCSDHLPVTMKIAVDVKLGVNDNTMPVFQASIAPNPASETATISFCNPSDSPIQFNLYSIMGQQIRCESAHFSTGFQQFELSLQGLSQGFYLLRLSNGEGWVQTLKLVVK